ncbi:MFS transporter [Vibrio rumoiensis]|uniref:Major facilitator superfamily (MFS) profile domain-containing protein n=1 Tax=Vibrio rumoiensis 1S-45 TaxID=1188252 RepID=A0A1E5DZL7_9VIBR|nr:MFS transporter [Vibrio rumoiensis]OEF23397.1 hypothetical protein A1QC_12030 [Vibrio rumoiensis 1S-45]
MWLFGSLLTLGINQTLLIALLPQIATLFGIDPQGNELGILAIALNVNLISYWIGSGLWGKYLQKISLTSAYAIASIGYIACHIAFISALFHFEQPQLWLASLSRLGLGLFSSAFMPIGQTYMARQEPAALNKLSQLSGIATLGRLLGPTFVFLPLALSHVLLLTIIPIFLSLLFVKWLAKGCMKYEEKHQSNLNRNRELTVTPTAMWTLAKRHYLTFITASLTTLLVAVYQLMLIPYLSKLGLNEQEVSRYLASIMVGISVMMAFNQLWLIPIMMAYPRLIWGSTVWALFITATLLSLPGYHLVVLLALSMTLTVALSNLPAWYSKQLLSIDTNPSHTGKLSGLLAQSHSTGHLLGTGCASIVLYFQLNIAYLLIAFITTLILFAVLLRRKYGLAISHT